MAWGKKCNFIVVNLGFKNRYEGIIWKVLRNNSNPWHTWLFFKFSLWKKNSRIFFQKYSSMSWVLAKLPFKICKPSKWQKKHSKTLINRITVLSLGWAKSFRLIFYRFLSHSFVRWKVISVILKDIIGKKSKEKLFKNFGILKEASEREEKVLKSAVEMTLKTRNCKSFSSSHIFMTLHTSQITRKIWNQNHRERNFVLF